MSLRWSRFAAALSVIAVVASATACSSDDGGDELLIYNAQHEPLTKEWIDAFTEETGIKVTYRQGGDTELGNQLIAEGDSSPADVFLTENSRSIMDLQQPEWKGRWGAPPPKADFQAIVAAMLQLTGEQATSAWLAGMKTNATLLQDNIATLRAVNAGQIDGGIIYHYYWFRDQAKTKEISANTELHYFRNEDPGAFISISGGGVLESSKKKDQA